jgi:anaerobic magnesium-protoporphyrin IX monomethyl ester cyclase
MIQCDVVLINPAWSKLGEKLENLGLGYIAATLRRNNYKVIIIDAPLMEWDSNRTIEEVKNIECKLIGVAIPFQDAAKEILEFISNLKKIKSNSHLTVGGIYPTFAYEEILKLYPTIDSIVIGEGEETTVDLAKAIINQGDFREIKGIAFRDGEKVIKTEIRASIEDLDLLPFPERDTLELTLKTYNFASIISSRGCYGRCSFCSVVPYYGALGKTYRVRSAENVLEEIEELYHNYGVVNIVFNDANFIGGSKSAKERAKKIAEEIIKRKLNLEFRIQCRVDDVDEELFALLKKAGLTRVYLGVESGSQTVLDRFVKDATVEDNIKAINILAKLNIFVAMGFIMFDDRININELSENVAFLNNVKKVLNKDMMSPIYPTSKLLPLAGTEVESYMKKSNKYIGNSLEYSYRFEDPIIRVYYRVITITSRISVSIKKLLRKDTNSDKSWIGGWRKA